jgi:hypothetical protein
MTATLVTVIGLSALLAARVELRASQTTNSIAEARLHARSAIEMALELMNTSANWRSTHTNNVWTTDRDIGPAGSFAYKFVDPADGDLANNLADPVKLYGRGVVGETARVYSLQVEFDASAIPTNLLPNPGVEGSTLSPWYGTSCTVAKVGTPVHSGSSAVLGSARLFSWAGPTLDVVGLENGVTYNVEAWMRVATGTDTARPVLFFKTSTGNSSVLGGTAAITSVGWSKLSTEFTATWTGTLNQAFLVFSTTAGVASLYVDDVLMIRADAVPIPAYPVRGTWRWEESD